MLGLWNPNLKIQDVREATFSLGELDSFFRTNPPFRTELDFNLCMTRSSVGKGQPLMLFRQYILEMKPFLYIPRTMLTQASILQADQYWMDHTCIWPMAFYQDENSQTENFPGYMIRLHKEYGQGPFVVLKRALHPVSGRASNLVFDLYDKGIGVMDREYHWLTVSEGRTGVIREPSALAVR